jgi:hypothetical protein
MVGVYTDANHHDDAYSKGLDLFWPKRYINIVGKQKIGLLNCYSKKNIKGECVKNWALLVASLISGKIEKQYI